MRKGFMAARQQGARRAALAVALATLIPVDTLAVDGARQAEFDIAPQQLSTAIVAFSRQGGVQVITASKDLDGLRTPAVKGRMSLRDAAEKMLDGTNLQAAFVEGQDAVAVRPRSDSKGGQQQNPTMLAQAQGAERQEAAGRSAIQLEGITVTAQKRTELLTDVPVPVTAVQAQALVDANQLRLQDYYARIPGFILSTGSRGEPLLAIRGISTNATPTVGITIDDLPYGASTIIGVIAPDFDPSELARVEVLRGPQGALYGANSMGGLIKYITIDPTTDRFSGRVQAGLNHVENGDGPGYALRGAVNLPVSKDLAVRVSGFSRRDAGYIDNVQTGEKGANRRDADSGRVSALWRPSDAVSLKLSAATQHSERRGSPYVYVQPGLEDLQQSVLRGAGWFHADTKAFGANLLANLGGFDLVSVTGYNVDAWSTSSDFTRIAGFRNLAQTNYGVSGVSIPEQVETKKFTQEVRLSGSKGASIDWLLGVFYADEKTAREQNTFAIDPATGAAAGVLGLATLPSTYKEVGLFANVTFRLSDRLDIQVGGRESRDDQTQDSVSSGLLGNRVFPTLKIEESAFTYLVTPRFKLSPDVMTYARFASGYRPGGPNINGPQFGLPAKYEPDKTQNYEVGIKGDVLDRTLAFDASLYYIEWKDIQVQLFDATRGQAYLTNAGRARSRGLEVAVQARPARGLKVGGWVVWNDATLSEPFPPGSLSFGVPGDRLPFGSKVSGNFSIEQEFQVSGEVRGFVGGLVAHVGERLGNFTATPARRVFPSYSQVDLSAGARYGTWEATFFATNVADERGELANAQSNAVAFNYIQPRTIGLSLSKAF